MATIQQKLLFAAATFRALTHTNREAMAAAGDIFGKDTEQARDDLNAVEYYANRLVETALKHGVRPPNIHELLADNVGDVLLIAATGKASVILDEATDIVGAPELKHPFRLPFGKFADILRWYAAASNANYTLTREADTKGGGQCMAATFTTDGNPADVLGMVYFNVVLAPTNANLTGVETAIRGK